LKKLKVLESMADGDKNTCLNHVYDPFQSSSQFDFGYESEQEYVHLKEQENTAYHASDKCMQEHLFIPRCRSMMMDTRAG
jgi:hypothetical protein